MKERTWAWSWACRCRYGVCGVGTSTHPWLASAGENESNALVKEINKQRQMRPLTHDVMKNILRWVGGPEVVQRVWKVYRREGQPGRGCVVSGNTKDRWNRALASLHVCMSARAPRRRA